MSDGRWDVYSNLRDSVFSFPRPEEFTATLTEAGFAHCKHRDIFLGVVYMFTCSTYVVPPYTEAGAEAAAPLGQRQAGLASVHGGLGEPVASTPARRSKARRSSGQEAAMDLEFGDETGADADEEEEEEAGLRSDL